MKQFILISSFVGSSLICSTGGFAQHSPSQGPSPHDDGKLPVTEHILQKATSYEAEGQWPQALAYIQRYLAARPGDCNALYLKLTILLSLEEHDAAAQVASLLLERPETLLPAWMPLIRQAWEAAGHTTLPETYYLLTAMG